MAPPPPRAGESPLHRAAWKGHTAIAEALLAAGANVNLQRNDGAWARAVELGVRLREGCAGAGGGRVRHGEGA
eukprot:345703-Pyramimonas_sp.AAC.1